MKTIKILSTLFLLGGTVVFAQGEFKKEWETKVKVENKWNSCNADLSLILMGDLKTFSMIDGTNGKVLWSCNSKEKFGIKEVEDWTFLSTKEGEPVEVVYKKPKTDSKTTVYLDPKTGEISSSFTTAKLVDKKDKTKGAKSKTFFADRTYDEASDTWVEVSYGAKKGKSAFGGSEMDLTIKASGGNTWSAAIKAICVRHLCEILLSSDEPEMMINVMVAQKKVFVMYEGITVLDLASGKVLWNTTFDNIKYSVGLKATQEIGRSSVPAVSSDAVYISDFTKGERVIKKLDINTGAVIWKGDKLSNDDIVSQLFVKDNVLIAKFGGTIRVEKFIPSTNGGISDGTYKVEFPYEGNTEIRAFDTETGKQIWNSSTAFKDEKLNKSECSILMNDQKLIVGSDKSFLLIDPKTGSINHKEDLGSKNIGKAQYVFVYDNNYIVEGSEGIASFTQAGKKNYAVSTDKRLMSEFKHDAYFVWVGKDFDDMNEFIRFDLSAGKIMGSLKGCYRPRFDDTGNYFIRFHDETVTKYHTSL